MMSRGRWTLCACNVHVYVFKVGNLLHHRYTTRRVVYLWLHTHAEHCMSSHYCKCYQYMRIKVHSTRGVSTGAIGN